MVLNIIITVLVPPMRVPFASGTYPCLCFFKVAVLAPSKGILFITATYLQYVRIILSVCSLLLPYML